MRERFVLREMGWLLAWGLVGLMSILSVSSPEADAPALSLVTSVLADFDGDARPDIALGRYEWPRYRIEVHFSRRPSAVSFGVPAREWGIVLLALDVNGDARVDLAAVSAHHAHPVAVWFGDGHGGFRRGKTRGWTLWRAQADGYTKAPTRGGEISLASEDRWPYDRPLLRSLGNAPECSALLDVESDSSGPMVFLAATPGRSPPEGPVHS